MIQVYQPIHPPPSNLKKSWNSFWLNMSESEITRKTQGMLDLQVNGVVVIDYNNSNLDPEDFEKSLQKMLATGVTSCLPTLISASETHL